MISPGVNYRHVDIIDEYRHFSITRRPVSSAESFLHVALDSVLKFRKIRFNSTVPLTLGSYVLLIYLEHIRSGGRGKVEHFAHPRFRIEILHVTLDHYRFRGTLFADQQNVFLLFSDQFDQKHRSSVIQIRHQNVTVHRYMIARVRVFVY